uniref:Metal-dependent carboxypeptidase n=1 Tax=Thermogemmatispora argillosa TaxID=2045280 RepID=A0A455T664_9CHLR|nr:carboxypeptidase M32 [Thermogemmatispora argillosa]
MSSLHSQQQQQARMPEFTRSHEEINALLGYLQEISDLAALGALAAWDQNTALPEEAGDVRGAQLATLQGLLHERWTSPELGRLVARLEHVVEKEPFTDADRALVREARREHEKAIRLPRSLVEEMARVEAASFEAWRRAREQNDFASFAPWLSRTVALQREVADRYGYRETRYDALLDLFEPGLTVRKLEALFAPVREVSLALLKRIQESGQTIDASCLYGHFPVAQQDALCKRLLEALGYDFKRGGLAHSPHPFTTSFGCPLDVRLTIHPQENFIASAVMAAIHEGGHALYEQGCAPALLRTPLAGGASMGVHESQSRLWENYIGRSEPFWKGQFHLLRTAFPEHFASIDAATFSRALNKVEPSLIRIEADEVTYNLHIIIRYELERELINGDLAVESLPSLWNARYREYLGVNPDSDRNGVLQDVHWTSGFGYFPSYTLGNLYAAQIYYTLLKIFPDFNDRLEQGDISFILEWLRQHMYVYGMIYLPEDLIKRVTGEAPNAGYFARYLKEKFGRIYELTD